MIYMMRERGKERGEGRKKRRKGGRKERRGGGRKERKMKKRGKSENYK